MLSLTVSFSLFSCVSDNFMFTVLYSTINNNHNYNSNSNSDNDDDNDEGENDDDGNDNETITQKFYGQYLQYICCPF